MALLKRLSTSVALIALIAPPALADGHMEAALKDFMTLVPGEFESRQQFLSEVAENVPAEDRHGWVYRSFVAIDAPSLGENVLVSTVRYGGANGSFDEAEFLVWTVDVDDEQLRMSPRQFIDQKPFEPVSRDAQQLARLTPDMLKPAGGAAGCDLLWDREDDHFYGYTEDGCRAMSYILETELTWKWEFWLGAEAVKITYSGTNDDDEVVSGRDDDDPWRLDRM